MLGIIGIRLGREGSVAVGLNWLVHRLVQIEMPSAHEPWRDDWKETQQGGLFLNRVEKNLPPWDSGRTSAARSIKSRRIRKKQNRKKPGTQDP
jgi:hypothetical protein